MDLYTALAGLSQFMHLHSEALVRDIEIEVLESVYKYSGQIAQAQTLQRCSLSIKY